MFFAARVVEERVLVLPNPSPPLDFVVFFFLDPLLLPANRTTVDAESTLFQHEDRATEEAGRVKAVQQPTNDDDM